MKKSLLYLLHRIATRASIMARSFFLLCIALLLAQAGVAQVLSGQAITLNAVNQYCTMLQSTPVTGEFTVEAWVRPDATTDRPMSIFSSRNNNDYSFDMKIDFVANGNSTIHADIGNGTAWLNTAASVAYKIEPRHWYHIAYTVSGSANQYIIYVNGRQVSSGAITSGTSEPILFNSTHTNANIGKNESTQSEYFLGLMDEVRIYSRVLNATEMLGEASGASTSSTGRVKYFSFENASGNTFTNLWNSSDQMVYQGSAISTQTSYALVLPEAIAPTSVAATSFIANWSAPVSGTVTNYAVDVATDQNFTNKVVDGQSVNVGSTSLTINSLSASTQYYYRVRANNTAITTDSYGAYSNTTSVTTYGVPTISSFTPSSAAYGGTVAITGTHFTSDAVVRFGVTNAASTTFNSSTSLTATVGAGSSGAITVTTLGGTATSAASFTYLQPAITSFAPNAAFSGSTVTITGAGFAPNSTVQFGGTDALSLVYNSSTSLTATVGTGSSGAITVTTLGGTATSAASFTYLQPTITSFAPNAAFSGSTVTITGAGFAPNSTVQFGGTDALSLVYNSSTSLTATVGTGSSGAITVTTLGGTATSAASFTFLPALKVLGNQFYCNGAATLLTAIGEDGATFEWYSVPAGGTLLGSTAQFAPPASSVDKHYFVQQTLNGLTSNRTDVLIKYQSLEAPTISSSGPSTFCQGGDVTLFTPNKSEKWTSLPISIGSTVDAVAFTIGNKAYIGTGEQHRQSIPDFWEFDPNGNVWTQKASYGGGSVKGAVGFSIGLKGYIGTGYNNDGISEFWEYDTSANTWQRKADVPGNARINATGFAIGNKGYIGQGGWGSYRARFL
jgi:hypothetical protein